MLEPAEDDPLLLTWLPRPVGKGTAAHVAPSPPLHRAPNASNTTAHTHGHTHTHMHSPPASQIRLLRSMLEWGRELGASIAAESIGGAGGDSPGEAELPARDAAAIAAWTEAQLALPAAQGRGGGDVMVVVWPGGRILRVPRGTTAGAWPARMTARLDTVGNVLLRATAAARFSSWLESPVLGFTSQPFHCAEVKYLSLTHRIVMCFVAAAPPPAGKVIRELGLIEIAPASGAAPSGDGLLPPAAATREQQQQQQQGRTHGVGGDGAAAVAERPASLPTPAPPGELPSWNAMVAWIVEGSPCLRAARSAERACARAAARGALVARDHACLAILPSAPPSRPAGEREQPAGAGGDAPAGRRLRRALPRPRAHLTAPQPRRPWRGPADCQACMAPTCPRASLPRCPRPRAPPSGALVLLPLTPSLRHPPETLYPFG